MHVPDDALALLAMCRIRGLDWHLLAREAQRAGGMERLAEAGLTEATEQARKAAELIKDADGTRQERTDRVEEELRRADACGALLITVLDDAYPRTLRLIYNLPPFLFVRGSLSEDDLRSVAVVGTRQASPDGITNATRVASQLAESEITVVSGLARGIDTAAHTAALEAGGRTIAVVGTGITRCYPAENKALQERIVGAGAVISQFWPSAPGATYTFPQRNITMSGIAQGTAVIEASSTSGAKMQARMALEHGKKVFLLRSLVDQHEWAQRYATRRGAHVVDVVDDILREVAPTWSIQADDKRRVRLSLL